MVEETAMSELPGSGMARPNGLAGKQVELGNSPVETKGQRAMQQTQGRREHPGLKELVVEASRALARLDADRLEELALSCQALNRDQASGKGLDRSALVIEAREAQGEMAVFARVLEATRANLNVIDRLRELRGSRLEYGERLARGWVTSESRHGDN